MLLPPEDYFMGATLPPHLSPFVTETDGEYVPPEKQALLNRQRGIDSGMWCVDERSHAAFQLSFDIHVAFFK